MTRTRVSLGFLLLALALLPLADLELAAADPGAEMARFVAGLLSPEVASANGLLRAVMLTFAFGLLGTLLAAPLGLLMALQWHRRWLRALAASVRAIHELFWALLFLQAFGLGPLTGLLAIALPYAGIFAKVFAEILAEQPEDATRALPSGTAKLQALLFVRLPGAWPQMRSYFFARAECGLRSSAVLGFVGLPTLGYHLDSALAYGAYSEAAAYLFALLALIAVFRWLMPPWSWPFWLLGLPWLLPGQWQLDTTGLLRFAGELLPAEAWSEGRIGSWLATLMRDAILPGLAQTLLLSVLALVACALAVLLLWPLAARGVTGRTGSIVAHGGLLVLRATPEYLLAYVLLTLWGPSMLPAIVALMLHNAAIIAFLLARASDGLTLRPDAPRGVRLFLWEQLPRLYGPYLAYLFYRWEIILRESAVVGILGVYTLGFHIDSALSEMRFSALLPLLAATVLLNLAVDAASRWLRTRLALQHALETSR